MSPLKGRLEQLQGLRSKQDVLQVVDGILDEAILGIEVIVQIEAGRSSCFDELLKKKKRLRVRGKARRRGGRRNLSTMPPRSSNGHLQVFGLDYGEEGTVAQE